MLVLPVAGIAGLGDVLGAFRPDAVVLAGRHEGDEEVARWAYRVRSGSGALPLALFHRAVRSERVRTTGAKALPDSPGQAHREVLAMLEIGPTELVPPPLTDEIGRRRAS